MEQETAGLVRRMAEGDSQVFDRLMELHYSRILRMAYLISGSHVGSEGIVQETFMLCWMNRKKIKEPEYFGNWLYGILTKEAWRYCRKNRKEQPVEEVFGKEEPETASVLEEVVMRSQEKEPYRVIRDLLVKQRATVVLYYLNQMSTREIVGIIGRLEGIVRSRLYMTRVNLKQELMEEHKRVGRGVTL